MNYLLIHVGSVHDISNSLKLAEHKLTVEYLQENIEKEKERSTPRQSVIKMLEAAIKRKGKAVTTVS